MVNGMVDMAKSESSQEATPLMPAENKYPYGLCINLDDESLEKLKVDISDWEIGDVFPLDILVKLTSKSCNESEGGGQKCSVSLQITHIGQEKEPEAEEELEEAHEDNEPSLEKNGYLRYKT